MPKPAPKIILGLCPNEGPERFIIENPDNPTVYDDETSAYDAGVAILNKPGSTTKAFRLFTVGATFRVVCRIEPDVAS